MGGRAFGVGPVCAATTSVHGLPRQRERSARLAAELLLFRRLRPPQQPPRQRACEPTPRPSTTLARLGPGRLLSTRSSKAQPVARADGPRRACARPHPRSPCGAALPGLASAGTLAANMARVHTENPREKASSLDTASKERAAHNPVRACAGGAGRRGTAASYLAAESKGVVRLTLKDGWPDC